MPRNLSIDSFCPDAYLFELKHRGVPCFYCGQIGRTLDHVVPKSRGGSDDRENLVIACERCNSSKGNKPQEEFFLDFIWGS